MIIYSKLRKFPWFPGYKVEIKYRLLCLKKYNLSFFMTIYSKLQKFPWFPGYKVEIKYKLMYILNENYSKFFHDNLF